MNWSNYFLRILPWYLAAEWVNRRKPQNVVPIRPEVRVQSPTAWRPRIRKVWNTIRLSVELLGWLSLAGAVLAAILKGGN